jgi:hypothetical protein
MDPRAAKAILKARIVSSNLRSTRGESKNISQQHRELKRGFFKRRQICLMPSSFKERYESLRAAIAAEVARIAT